jgi:hypothetical protein
MDRPVFRTIYAACVFLGLIVVPGLFVVGAIIAAFPVILVIGAVAGVLVLIAKICENR